MSLSQKRCLPCEGFSKPFDQIEEENYIKQIDGWTLNCKGEHRIIKKYNFADFANAVAFVNKIADLAENEGHHPNILIKYNLVEIELYTHAIGGLSENDFILAAKIDGLLK